MACVEKHKLSAHKPHTVWARVTIVGFFVFVVGLEQCSEASRLVDKVSQNHPPTHPKLHAQNRSIGSGFALTKAHGNDLTASSTTVIRIQLR